MMSAHHTTTNSGNNKMTNRNHDCQCEIESLGLSWQGEENKTLDIDKILTLFEGSRDNLNYFIGLWNAMTSNTVNAARDGANDSLCLSPNCDPRDERKRNSVKDWRPSRVFFPVDVGVGMAGEGFESDIGSDKVVEVLAGSYAAKQTVLDEGEDDGKEYHQVGPGLEGVMKRFPCGVPGCRQVLTTLANFESHYHHCHNYVCDACRRVCVSSFLLDIHLQENHDSYFAILSQRIDMYRCLVESCEQKFRTQELRKDHMVSVHKFPSSFSFHQPVKSNRSLKSTSTTDTSLSSSSQYAVDMECENNNPEESESTSIEDDSACPAVPMDTRKAGNSKQRQQHSGKDKKKVPTSVCFGRGSQRAFQQRRGRGRGKKTQNWFQQTSHGCGGDATATKDMADTTTVNIESVDMTDLADALN